MKAETRFIRQIQKMTNDSEFQNKHIREVEKDFRRTRKLTFSNVIMYTIGNTRSPLELEAQQKTPEHKNMGKSSMSPLTSLSLSFNNLRTKKARTLLTSFAGSIGIIGIALILALSTGVNAYIEDIQKSTMISYPISIEAQSIDLSSLISQGDPHGNTDEVVYHALDGIYSNGSKLEMASAMMNSITENNLTAFKKYLDNTDSEIHQYIGENGIVYSYDVQFSVYTHDPDGTFVNTDGSTLEENAESAGMNGAMGGMGAMMGTSSSNFEELLSGQEDTLISPALTESCEVIYGAWPQAYDEVILVLDEHNEISATTLYQLGILPTAEYRELMSRIEESEEITLETERYDYEDICNQEFYMIPACDTYIENENGTFTCVSNDTEKMETLMEEAVQLKVTGIVYVLWRMLQMPLSPVHLAIQKHLRIISLSIQITVLS